MVKELNPHKKLYHMMLNF
jgi:hypothetical protein